MILANLLEADSRGRCDRRRRFRLRQSQPPVGGRPASHPQQHLGGRIHRLGNHDLVRRCGHRFCATSQCARIGQIERPDRRSLEVMLPLTRLDERDLARRPKERQRQSRESGAGAKIHERGWWGLGEDCAERNRTQDQPASDRIRAAMSGQIRALRPPRDQPGKVREGTGRLDGKPEFGEPGL